MVRCPRRSSFSQPVVCVGGIPTVCPPFVQSHFLYFFATLMPEMQVHWGQEDWGPADVTKAEEKETKWLEAALSHFFLSSIWALLVCPLYLPPLPPSTFSPQRCKTQNVPRRDILCQGRNCSLI